MKLFKGIEKLVLRFLLSREELYIVNKEHFGFSVFILEFIGGIVFYAVNELIYEGFGGYIYYIIFRMTHFDFVFYRVKKVGLAETRFTVDIKGIEIRFSLSYRSARCARKLVAFADDKCIEGIFIIAVYLCFEKSCLCIRIIIEFRNRIGRPDYFLGSNGIFFLGNIVFLYYVFCFYVEPEYFLELCFYQLIEMIHYLRFYPFILYEQNSRVVIHFYGLDRVYKSAYGYIRKIKSFLYKLKQIGK